MQAAGRQKVDTDSQAAGGGRSVSAQSHAESQSEVAPSSNLASELGAAKGYYAARIGAARRTLSPAEIAAAIRAIKNEQKLAVRAIINRWLAYFENRKQKSAPERPSGAKPLLRYPGLRKG